MPESKFVAIPKVVSPLNVKADACEHCQGDGCGKIE